MLTTCGEGHLGREGITSDGTSSHVERSQAGAGEFQIRQVTNWRGSKPSGPNAEIVGQVVTRIPGTVVLRNTGGSPRHPAAEILQPVLGMDMSGFHLDGVGGLVRPFTVSTAWAAVAGRSRAFDASVLSELWPPVGGYAHFIS